MANDDWDIFDKELKRTIEISRKTMDLCIQPYIKELAIYKRALELACKDRCHRCYSMVTSTCQYDPKTYDCKSEQMFINQAKKELEE